MSDLGLTLNTTNLDYVVFKTSEDNEMQYQNSKKSFSGPMQITITPLKEKRKSKLGEDSYEFLLNSTISSFGSELNSLDKRDDEK